MRIRDKRGRFTKAKAEVKVIDENYEENSGDDEESHRYGRRRRGGGVYIRIPFYEFIPFFCLIFVILVIATPWILIIKPASMNLFKIMARLLYASVDSTMGKNKKDSFD